MYARILCIRTDVILMSEAFLQWLHCQLACMFDSSSHLRHCEKSYNINRLKMQSGNQSKSKWQREEATTIKLWWNIYSLSWMLKHNYEHYTVETFPPTCGPEWQITGVEPSDLSLHYRLIARLAITRLWFPTSCYCDL